MEKQSDYGYGSAKPQSSDMASSQEPKEASAPKSSSNEPVLLKVSDLENNPMCRICYNGPSRERLVRPCKCKGTIEYVHRHCLERWLESTNCETCELCRYHFTTRKTRKSFWEWCRQPETRHDRRNFIGDFTCFAFLTPLGIATFWLCAEGAIYYQKVKNSTLETIALVTLAVFLVMAYVTWIVLCTRYHLMIWNRWRNHNWHVRVVDRASVSPQISSEEMVVSVPPQSSSLREPLIPAGQTIRVQLQDTRGCPAHDTSRNAEPGMSGQNQYSYPSRISTV
ncbi:e3 ubiquitin-protein ligase MARCH3 [Trichonephila clavata]|uniref:E3 ubiquitin-protein ligase MARCH3 n=1 Tax=Trichonephila clavata TaxID=2740835 RepID=A0A8X6LDF3_TRICU|nr:e3 ubiquitin-protein ligase MARCH3 [Trichonephila clavata]